jgi:hypothetical protein
MKRNKITGCDGIPAEAWKVMVAKGKKLKL